MANYLPFNSINADRAVKAEDWAWYFSTFIGNGVFPNPSDGLQVMASSAMQIAVKAGYGYINGYAFKNESSFLIDITTADGVLPRIDRIVLRWDLSDRLMEIAVLEGTPSASPTAPALTRSADRYELALADVNVRRGTTEILQADITDRRYNTSLCGIVAGVVDQIDPSTITAQFDSFVAEYTARVLAYEDGFVEDMESWENAQRIAFTEWFEHLQDILDEETATHLQNEIEALQTRMDLMEYRISQNDLFFPLLSSDDEMLLTDNDEVLIVDWKYQTI